MGNPVPGTGNSISCQSHHAVAERPGVLPPLPPHSVVRGTRAADHFPFNLATFARLTSTTPKPPHSPNDLAHARDFILGQKPAGAVTPSPAPAVATNPDQRAQGLDILSINAFLYMDPTWKQVFFETPDAQNRVVKLAKFIAEKKPDVVFLQEVWQLHWADLLIAELVRLKYLSAKNLNEHAVTFSRLGKGNNDLVVLSPRHKLSDPEFIPFHWQGSLTTECGRRGADEKFVMGVGMVTLNLPGNREVLLANNHPMHRRPDEAHHLAFKAQFSEQRAAQLIETAVIVHGQKGNRPVIMGGDFNFNVRNQWEFAKVFDPLFGNYSGSFSLLAKNTRNPDKLCTYCEENTLSMGPTEGVLDHIFVSPGLQLTRANIHKQVKSVFTDHEILEARVVVPPATLEPIDRPIGFASACDQISLPLEEAVLTDVIRGIRNANFDVTCYLTDFNEARRQATLDWLATLRTDALQCKIASAH